MPPKKGRLKAIVLLKTARQHVEHGRHAAALAIFQSLIKTGREQQLSADLQLECQVAAAQCHMKLGTTEDLARARELYEGVVFALTVSLGQDHERVHEAMIGLAETARLQGDVVASERISNILLASQTSSQAGDVFDALFLVGRYDEAVEALSHEATALVTSRGERHPATIQAKTLLAETCLFVDADRSLKLLRRLAARGEAVLGPRHALNVRIRELTALALCIEGTDASLAEAGALLDSPGMRLASLNSLLCAVLACDVPRAYAVQAALADSTGGRGLVASALELHPERAASELLMRLMRFVAEVASQPPPRVAAAAEALGETLSAASPQLLRHLVLAAPLLRDLAAVCADDDADSNGVGLVAAALQRRRLAGTPPGELSAAVLADANMVHARFGMKCFAVASPLALQQLATPALLRCVHPNLLPLLALVSDQRFALYELCGPTLASVLDGAAVSGGLAAHQAVRLARDACRGLAYLHACGQAHGGLEPSCVRVDHATGAARLAGYGLVPVAGRAALETQRAADVVALGALVHGLVLGMGADASNRLAAAELAQIAEAASNAQRVSVGVVLERLTSLLRSLC